MCLTLNQDIPSVKMLHKSKNRPTFSIISVTIPAVLAAWIHVRMRSVFAKFLKQSTRQALLLKRKKKLFRMHLLPIFVLCATMAFHKVITLSMLGNFSRCFVVCYFFKITFPK